MECLQSGDWWIVLTGTQFGHIWLFRMIVSLVFGIILWLVARKPRRRSFLQINPRRAFNHRAFLPGVGWPRRRNSGPVRSRPPFGRCTPSCDRSVLARRAGASRRIPSIVVKIKSSGGHWAGGISGSPILSKQSDRGGCSGIDRTVEWHFHGRQFSGTRDECLRSDTRLQSRPLFRDDRVRCDQSFLTEAKDRGQSPDRSLCTKERHTFTAEKRPLGNRIGCGCNPYCWIAWNHSAAYAQLRVLPDMRSRESPLPSFNDFGHLFNSFKDTRPPVETKEVLTFEPHAHEAEARLQWRAFSAQSKAQRSSNGLEVGMDISFRMFTPHPAARGAPHPRYRNPTPASEVASGLGVSVPTLYRQVSASSRG